MGSTFTITVNNPSCLSSSIIILQPIIMGVTPNVIITPGLGNVSNGSFEINLSNFGISDSSGDQIGVAYWIS